MEKGPKALRKMQSFLHFLAFGSFDHSFGVLRGEQPLRRGSLPRNSETFFATFFGHKKGRPNDRMPLKRVKRRRVARNKSRALQSRPGRRVATLTSHRRPLTHHQ